MSFSECPHRTIYIISHSLSIVNYFFLFYPSEKFLSVLPQKSAQKLFKNRTFSEKSPFSVWRALFLQKHPAPKCKLLQILHCRMFNRKPCCIAPDKLIKPCDILRFWLHTNSRVTTKNTLLQIGIQCLPIFFI